MDRSGFILHLSWESIHPQTETVPPEKSRISYDISIIPDFMQNFIPSLLSIAKIHAILSHLSSADHSLDKTLDIGDSAETNVPIQLYGCDWCRKRQFHGKPEKSERLCKRALPTAKHVFLTCLESDPSGSVGDFISNSSSSIVEESELFRLDGLCVVDLRSFNRLQARMCEIEKSLKEILNKMLHKIQLHGHLYRLRGLFFMEEMELIGPFCEFIFLKV